MRRNLIQYLDDILAALAHIEAYVAGVSFEDYRTTPLIHRATERVFTIVGEAVRQMTNHFPEVKARVDSTPQIISFRNFIIHEYSHVDDASVWDAALHDAPVLRAQIRNWKDELEASNP